MNSKKSINNIWEQIIELSSYYGEMSESERNSKEGIAVKKAIQKRKSEIIAIML